MKNARMQMRRASLHDALRGKGAQATFRDGTVQEGARSC